MSTPSPTPGSKIFKEPCATVAPKRKRKADQSQQKPIAKNTLGLFNQLIDVPDASSHAQTESRGHISRFLDHTQPTTDHEAPRKISLVVKILPDIVLGGLYGFTNMLLTIHNFDEFKEYMQDAFELSPEDCPIMYATTRPSLGPLSPLKPWDIVGVELNESSWEAVIAIAEIQGWLGVMVDCL